MSPESFAVTESVPLATGSESWTACPSATVITAPEGSPNSYSTCVAALGVSEQARSMRSLTPPDPIVAEPRATELIPSTKSAASKRKAISLVWCAVHVEALDEESNTPTVYGWADTHCWWALSNAPISAIATAVSASSQRMTRAYSVDAERGTGASKRILVATEAPAVMEEAGTMASVSTDRVG